MTIESNPIEYLSSLSLEIKSRFNRIRNLIGDKHWLTDGHHKEYLIQGILERFLPNGFVCGRGFVVRDQDLRVISKEQDLLVVDCRKTMPLFNESGVIVCFAENVRCAISVKTELSTASLADSIIGLNSVPTVASCSVLRGVFAFTISDSWENNQLIRKWLQKRISNPPTGQEIEQWDAGVISVDDECLFKFRKGHEKLHGEKTKRLSTAVFLATVADFVKEDQLGSARGINDLLTSTAFDQIH